MHAWERERSGDEDAMSYISKFIAFDHTMPSDPIELSIVRSTYRAAYATQRSMLQPYSMSIVRNAEASQNHKPCHWGTISPAIGAQTC
jgi:hypothetical protein